MSAVPALHGLLAAALIRAAHTLVALSGMTVAVGADVDCAQVTAVLRVVMTAGRNGWLRLSVFFVCGKCAKPGFVRQLAHISKLGLDSKIKKFSYSFICGKGYSPPSEGE